MIEMVFYDAEPRKSISKFWGNVNVYMVYLRLRLFLSLCICVYIRNVMTLQREGEWLLQASLSPNDSWRLFVLSTPKLSGFLSVNDDKIVSRSRGTSSLSTLKEAELFVRSLATEGIVGCVCPSRCFVFNFVHFTKRCTNPFSFRSLFRCSFLIRCTTSHISSSETRGSLQHGHSWRLIRLK